MKGVFSGGTMGEGKIFGDKGEGNIREPVKGF